MTAPVIVSFSKAYYDVIRYCGTLSTPDTLSGVFYHLAMPQWCQTAALKFFFRHPKYVVLKGSSKTFHFKVASFQSVKQLIESLTNFQQGEELPV